MIRRPPRSTLFPTRRSSDLERCLGRTWSEPCPAGRNLRRIGTGRDRKSTRLNSSHLVISYAVFCLKKKNIISIRLLTLLHQMCHTQPAYPYHASVSFALYYD